MQQIEEYTERHKQERMTEREMSEEETKQLDYLAEGIRLNGIERRQRIEEIKRLQKEIEKHTKI